MSLPSLRLQDLRLAFDPQAPLIDRLSRDLAPGLIVLRGDSGSGKTSLLRILAGALPPEAGWSGQITLAGQPLGAASVFWRELWADADSDVTPMQCLQAWRQAHKRWDDITWQQHVSGFGLAPHLGKPMLALSAGSRRKLALAAGLASGASLTLLDEPTAGLDAPSVAHLAQALPRATAAAPRWIWLAEDGGLPPLRDAQVIRLPA
jgi:ABC-type multidrug transport system ATPase subunit